MARAPRAAGVLAPNSFLLFWSNPPIGFASLRLNEIWAKKRPGVLPDLFK